MKKNGCTSYTGAWGKQVVLRHNEKFNVWLVLKPLDIDKWF